LTAKKRNPGQSTLPGFYRLLPQLVGSCDPGGRVSGDGLPPELTYQFEFYPHLPIEQHNAATSLNVAQRGQAHGVIKARASSSPYVSIADGNRISDSP
jgi:hypothetical protein